MRSSDDDRPDRVARREQKDVFADTNDLHAFLYGVKESSALKRVTITPVIRTFPKDLIMHSIPWGSRLQIIPQLHMSGTNTLSSDNGTGASALPTMRVLSREPN
ncbi:uncharacterized protein N7479_005608 [Penicillium vulpinum]|uniref:Uncharacterized protein n=1 Tax=Penicillium vulpinum TaxID=29845 RepID=A0A1V6SDN6_9EURO|nr:uncharacterized protein N7479_005608 [Penicillium vulpinum]KAJ5958458.1 hypothetical protein N7479_005608 [Penicillium vulpinum]OQE12135.1 hypothetical protein PENVUL_c001G08043 [Penicillium vulpinum]